MGFGGLLNQLATTTAGGGMGAVVENYPIASGQSINAGDVVDVNEDGEVIGNKPPLGSFSPGDVVLLNENGTEVEFYVAKHDYESSLNGAGRTLVVRKDCYDNQVWGSGTANAYASSNLDNWFNSTYKNMLNADIRSLIGTTKFRYTPGNGNNTVGTLERAIFALSFTELGKSNVYANTEGTALPIASTLQIVYRNGSPTTQWTRSPGTNTTASAWKLGPNDDIANNRTDASFGSRPAFTLPDTYCVNDSSGHLNTQAIALQSGTAGQTIPVCYSGIVKAPFVSQGDVISSPGVTGVGILDGVLQVYAKDAPGKIVTGSYVGTGTYGSGNPNTLTFNGVPKLVFIAGRETTGNKNINIGFFVYPFDRYVSGNSSSGSFTIQDYLVVLEFSKTLKWYTSTSSDLQFNISGVIYNYVAFL